MYNIEKLKFHMNKVKIPPLENWKNLANKVLD